MSLPAGTRFGPYEILAALGAGGMGDVYRGRDTRLNRDVAIKVLPDEFARDAQRLARFEREAQALAALNHPNILAIHDFARQDGTVYAAMELLDGETLRQRLLQGALAARKAMDYAAQIARGLAAAHDKGVVHRDLKPENIIVLPDGRVKILDFGLALHVEAAGMAATELGATREGTTPGTVMGTVGYMSPEQVRGEKVDARSDIFSFGAVLSEMLSGRRAFAKGTAAETMTAILNEEPQALAEAAELPPGLQALVLHCLEKNPAERFQSARDLAFALEQSSGSRPAQRGEPATPAVWRPLRPWLIAAATLAVGVAGGYALSRVTAGTGAPLAASATPTFNRLTFGRGLIRTARFSPDGSTIVYGASWDNAPLQVYLTRTDSRDSTPLQLPPAQVHGVSSRGELALTVGHTYEGWMGEGTLARAPLLGGGVREMLEHVREADWAPDGSDLAIVRRENGRERLEFPPGRVLHDTAGYVSNIRFAPKGDRIAFVDHPVYADDLGVVTIVDLEGHATALSPPINGMRGLAWGPGGQEIWFSAANESGCRIDAVTLSGARRSVLTSWSLCTLLDVAPDGRALIGSETSLRQVEAITRASAEPRAFPLPTDQAVSRSITPDGSRLVFTDQAPTGYAAYVYPASGDPPVRVGTGEAVDLSPDGRWLLALTQTTPSRILLHPTGPGTTRELPNPDEIIVDHARWLPDGRRVVFFGRTATGPGRGYVQDVQSGPPVAFTPERADPRAWWTFAVSPDGARVTMRGADGVVALAPVGSGAPQPLPQFPADAVPVQWSEDGRALIVGQRINAGWAVSRFDIATGRMQKIRDLVANEASGFRLTFLAASPNGQYLVHSYSRLLVDVYLVQGLR